MEMTKEELRKLYYSKRNKEVCMILGVTNVTLVATLKRYKIPLKKKGNRYPKYKVIVK